MCVRERGAGCAGGERVEGPGSVLGKWQNKYHQRPASSLWGLADQAKSRNLLHPSFLVCTKGDGTTNITKLLGLIFNTFATECPKGVSWVPWEDKSNRNST